VEAMKRHFGKANCQEDLPVRISCYGRMLVSTTAATLAPRLPYWISDRNTVLIVIKAEVSLDPQFVRVGRVRCNFPMQFFWPNY
jgi:hypothetical protein